MGRKDGGKRDRRSSKSPDKESDKGKEVEEHTQSSQSKESKIGKHSRGWSKSKFMVYFVGSTFVSLIATIGFSFLLQEYLPAIKSFLGFLFILVPLGYSILGVRYSKAKYDKYLWNAKTWIPASELVICLAALALYVFHILENSSPEPFTSAFLMLLLNMLGGSLLIAYWVGRSREKRQIAKEIEGLGENAIDIDDIAYSFGIKKTSAKKQVERLLSDGRLNGYVDERIGYLIMSGLKDDILNYIRKNQKDGEIPLQDISKQFQISEDIVVNIIRSLKQDRTLGGEINQIEGVYHLSTISHQGQERESEQFKPSDIQDSLSELKEEEKMIDTRAIETRLEEDEVDKAGELLEELQNKYRDYKATLRRLEEIDNRLSDLSEKLASGEIDNESFKSAKKGLENKKFDLEEKLEKLRKEVIREDYEKPF